MLNQYITDTQLLLNDTGGQFFSDANLKNYINRSRRRVAAVSGCIRMLPPGTQTLPNVEIYPFKNWNSLVAGMIPGASRILACRSLAIGVGGKWGRPARNRCDPGSVDPADPLRVMGGSWKPLWRRIPWTDFQARFRIYGGTFMGTIS